MLNRNLARIDKFYYLFALTIFVLVGIFIVTINGIFFAMNKSKNISGKETAGQPLNETKMNTVYLEMKNQKTIPLDTRF